MAFKYQTCTSNSGWPQAWPQGGGIVDVGPGPDLEGTHIYSFVAYPQLTPIVMIIACLLYTSDAADE